MTGSATQAQMDAAAAYEELFVPALFGEWASRVVSLAGLQRGQRVLDVACGTGVLARAAARVGGQVVGLDPSSGMLVVARRLDPALEWREDTAEALPFPDCSFDAVVSQFGLMFFRNRSGALREMLRVLVPGGRLTVAVWDELAAIPAYAAEVELLERLAGKPAADALRAPFVLGDPAELTALFTSAGVQSVALTTERGTGRFPSARTMVEAELRGWLPVMGVELSEVGIASVLARAEQALGPYLLEDGTVEFETSAHIVTGARRST